jgi:hypothetical protein
VVFVVISVPPPEAARDPPTNFMIDDGEMTVWWRRNDNKEAKADEVKTEGQSIRSIMNKQPNLSFQEKATAVTATSQFQ